MVVSPWFVPAEHATPSADAGNRANAASVRKRRTIPRSYQTLVCDGRAKGVALIRLRARHPRNGLRVARAKQGIWPAAHALLYIPGMNANLFGGEEPEIPIDDDIPPHTD